VERYLLAMMTFFILSIKDFKPNKQPFRLH